MKKNSFIDKIKKTDAAAKSQRGRKPHIPFRLNLLFFVIFTLFVSLIVRLGYLQIVEGEEFNKKNHCQFFTTNHDTIPSRTNL